MKLPEICIRRPVLATVMTLFLLIIGAVSFTYLTVRQYPQVDRPVISVATTYEGASPKIVEMLVTKPLEAALSGIEGLEYMTSTSQVDTSYINLYLRPNRSIDEASSDVRDRIARIRANLPDGTKNPTIKKAEAEASPIIYLALSGEGQENAALYSHAYHHIKNELESVPGVASVDLYGGNTYVVHIWLDPTKMSAYNVAAHEVSAALRRQNVHAPAGRLSGTDREFHVSTNANLKDVASFEQIVVGHHKDYVVSLKDIARVEFSAAEERSLAMFNDKPAVAIALIKKSVANPVEISREIIKILPDIRRELPKGMSLEIAFDTSVFVEQSIHEVYRTLFEATICVIFVILLFLWSFRASIIPLIAIPVSLIGTFSLLYLFGFSLNMLTLLAIVLSIGLVVDDAIVVLENIYRHMEEGMDTFSAAIKGSKEISFSIIAMTLTLAAVYAPIALSSGNIGRLFTEFALTLAGAVMISGFIALTLSPMMCSRLLVVHSGGPTPFDRYYQKFELFYRRCLMWALERRSWVAFYGAAFAFIGLMIALFWIPSEVAPREDQGVIYTFANSPQEATVPYIKKYMDQVEQVFRTVPEVVNRLAIIQAPESEGWNMLKPWGERKRTSGEILQSIQQKLRDIAGLNVWATPGRALIGGGNANRVDFVLQTTKSFEELTAWAVIFEKALQKTGVIPFLQGDFATSVQEFAVEVDREKAASLDVNVGDVAETLDIFIGGRRVTDFKRHNEQFEVQIAVPEDKRRAPDDLSLIYVKGAKNQMTPLSNIVKIHKDPIPSQIQHYNKLLSITLTGDLAPGRTLGEAVEILERLSHEVLPDTIRADFSGGTKQMIEARYTMYFIFGLALLFIYLIMAAQFESFTDPFIIMFSVPLSLAGAVVSLKLTGGTFNVYTQIGLITLIGLITKHGILIVDFANKKRESSSIQEAVFESACLRLRPILMTTFAMALGALPLVWAGGAGAESRRQMGWVVVGGMLLGTLFTLFVVPVVYTFFSRQSKGLR